MRTICLHDKHEIEKFLRKNAFLHLYSIGDLDDFFWPYTTWYAWSDADEIRHLALLYTGTSLPVLLCIAEQPSEEMKEFLQSLIHLLPGRFYAHLNSEMAKILSSDYEVQSHGTHYKMALLAPQRLETIDTSHVIQLTEEDIPDLEALYHISYPGNWFDPRMVETGCYYGVRHGNTLVSAAGIHVYSKHYKVVALGNITTHPEARRQKLATASCAKLCQSLLQTVDHIGLNVKTDNISAISCYEHLGFTHIAAYEEFMCTSLR